MRRLQEQHIEIDGLKDAQLVIKSHCCYLMRVEKRKNRGLKLVLSCLAIFVLVPAVHGANPAEVSVPGYHDKYSRLVKLLESGQTKINYKEFRESFLESEQFKVAARQRDELSALRKRLPALMSQAKYSEIIVTTKKMLSLDYTDMEAHKILRQTYKILGETVKANKYHDIEFGLLNSILKGGDGEACETGWPVIQVSEEYFILEMLGADLRRQSLDQADGLCDKMEVQTKEGKQTYYFEVSKVFEGYKKLGLK